MKTTLQYFIFMMIITTSTNHLLCSASRNQSKSLSSATTTFLLNNMSDKDWQSIKSISVLSDKHCQSSQSIGVLDEVASNLLCQFFAIKNNPHTTQDEEVAALIAYQNKRDNPDYLSIINPYPEINEALLYRHANNIKLQNYIASAAAKHKAKVTEKVEVTETETSETTNNTSTTTTAANFSNNPLVNKKIAEFMDDRSQLQKKLLNKDLSHIEKEKIEMDINTLNSMILFFELR